MIPQLSGWGYLSIAIILEIMATICLKLSDGFANYTYAGLSILLYSVCFWFFAPALKYIPVGTAYAIWSGVGILAVAIIGAFFFKERLELIQYGFILLILVGAVGLRLTMKGGG